MDRRSISLLLVFVALQAQYQHASGGGNSLNNPNQKTPGDGRPRIYIYPLPDEQYRREAKNARQENGTFYGLNMLFPRHIRYSPYITDDPEKATHFYVDYWNYWVNQGGNHVVAYLKSKWPYWDRTNGADHIFTVPHDFGRCDFYDQVEDAILLHHFGKVSWPQIAAECNLFDKWGGECDSLMQNALKAHKKETFRACHIPGQDMVVPPPPYELTEQSPHFISMYTNPDKLPPPANRTNLLFYSGKIDLHADQEGAKLRPWSDAGYSFGVRQSVHHMFAGKPGFAIHSSHTHGSYWQDLTNATFCLASAGWGWGGRMKVAVTRGCIPLIIQDGIKVEWEEQLPVHDYAVRYPLWMAHKTDKLLHWYMRTGRVAKMQANLQCAWRMHWWHRPHGRAFEVTMCALKRRLLGKPGVIPVDWKACALDCGDGKWVPLKDTYNNV